MRGPLSQTGNSADNRLILKLVTYWKRENGDWIVFEKVEEEQKAHYFGFEFFLFFSDNFRAWFLMYDDTGDSLDAGNVEMWDEKPSPDQVQHAVESFLRMKFA